MILHLITQRVSHAPAEGRLDFSGTKLLHAMNQGEPRSDGAPGQEVRTGAIRADEEACPVHRLGSGWGLRLTPWLTGDSERGNGVIRWRAGSLRLQGAGLS